MQKQLYFLVLILVVFFVFYSVYYYSNYRVPNSPVINQMKDLNKSGMTFNPWKDSLKQLNIIYSPGSNLALKRYIRYKGKQLSDTNVSITLSKTQAHFNLGEIPNNNFIYRHGRYSDSTSEVIKGLQKRWFGNKFVLQTDLEKQTPYIFTHTYKKVMFNNSFRLFNPGLVFKEDTVKAIETFGNVSKGVLRGIKLYREGQNQIVVLQLEEGEKMVFAGIRGKNTLYQAYQEVSKKIQQNKGETLSKSHHLVIPIMDFHLLKKKPVLDQEKALTILTKVSIGMNTEFSVLNTPETPPNRKKVWFDKPFLFFYKPKPTKSPYILAWISNPEILLRKGRGNL